MLPYTTFDDIIRNIRKVIIDHVEVNNMKLDNNRVLNATSVRGPDLLKIINETELNSFNLKDSFIVFELKESNDKPYYVLQENDFENSIVYYYHMDIKLYGSLCHIVSQKILSVFKEENILLDLYEKGIHFEGVTPPESANEFINDTLWKRCDMTLKFEARMLVLRTKADEFFDENTPEMDVINKLIVKETS